MHRRGAFGIARFDRQGNARAFTTWNEQQAGSTFFISVYPKVFENALKETEG